MNCVLFPDNHIVIDDDSDDGDEKEIIIPDLFSFRKNSNIDKVQKVPQNLSSNGVLNTSRLNKEYGDVLINELQRCNERTRLVYCESDSEENGMVILFSGDEEEEDDDKDDDYDYYDDDDDTDKYMNDESNEEMTIETDNLSTENGNIFEPDIAISVLEEEDVKTSLAQTEDVIYISDSEDTLNIADTPNVSDTPNSKSSVKKKSLKSFCKRKSSSSEYSPESSSSDFELSDDDYEKIVVNNERHSGSTVSEALGDGQSQGGRRSRRIAVKKKCKCCGGDFSHHEKEITRMIKEEEMMASKRQKLKDTKIDGKKELDKKKNVVKKNGTNGGCISNENFSKTATEVAVKTDIQNNIQYFNCPLCKEDFNEEYNFMTHWRKNHALKDKTDLYNLIPRINNFKECFRCQKILKESSNIKGHFSWHNDTNKSIQDCFLCGTIYHKVSRHVKAHLPYKCLLCDTKFSTYVDLNNHLITHLYEVNCHDNDKNKCKLCDKVFNSVFDNVLEHYIAHHECNILTTDDLIKNKINFTTDAIVDFKKKRGISQSDVEHKTDTTRYICSYCTIEYVDKHVFLKHLLSQHNNIKNECEICKKSFLTYKELHHHNNSVHFNEKISNGDIIDKITCPACSKNFIHAKLFKSHFDKHSENDMTDRKINCPLCSLTVYNVFSLKRHLLCHTGEKPHACTSCDAKFREKKNLQHHLMTMHNEKYSYYCNICNNQFKTKSALKSHLRNRHLVK